MPGRNRKPLSSKNPLLYKLSISLRRIARRISWLLGGRNFAGSISGKSLPLLVVEHRSLLLRKLAGTDQKLQRNKVESLKLACGSVDGVKVGPGETFSFWRLIGQPSEERGFRPGLQLSFGKLVSRTGGGLCQLSNLLHWMVLQTPMTVTERHRHDTDPFPDYRRAVPFGSGATVFYNYLDLMFLNGTDQVFQIRTWIDDQYLQGEIRTGRALRLLYSIEERNHRFVKTGSGIYRENELWRKVTDAESGKLISEELLLKNHSRVCYDTSKIPGIEVVDLS